MVKAMQRFSFKGMCFGANWTAGMNVLHLCSISFCERRGACCISFLVSCFVAVVCHFLPRVPLDSC